MLDTYSLAQILELNDASEAELLHFAVEEEFLRLPEPEPCDVSTPD